MSAERLRAAAALMRERAKSVPEPSPWLVMRSLAVVSAPAGRIAMTVASTFPTGGSDRQRAASEYIASWHPVVALAVAAWLDSCATYAEDWGQRAGDFIDAEALSVADAYLGTR